MNLPGPAQLMQQYNNHAAGVSHFETPRGSLGNSFSQNMPTFITGEDETNNWCNVWNSLNLATRGQEAAVKSFPQQY